jgi:hypothetical protein
MSYKPISVDRINLTIMGIQFPNLEMLESIAESIGSNMFEGYEPAPRQAEIIRDYCLGKISSAELIELAKQMYYGK